MVRGIVAVVAAVALLLGGVWLYDHHGKTKTVVAPAIHDGTLTLTYVPVKQVDLSDVGAEVPPLQIACSASPEFCGALAALAQLHAQKHVGSCMPTDSYSFNLTGVLNEIPLTEVVFDSSLCDIPLDRDLEQLLQQYAPNWAGTTQKPV